MKAARFSFGCEHFDTKKAAAERIRAILYSYHLGASLGAYDARDGDTVTRLADPVLAAAWSAWHAERARLRMVSRRANLSLLRRGRRTH